jgi:peptide/nickel transport system substrate-binding protein
MKPFSRFVAAPAAMLAVAGFSGCTPEVSCDSGWCGTVVVLSAPAISLFPPTPEWDVDLGITDMMFMHLADVGPDLNPVGDVGFVPKLAREWQFEDSLSISFTIHPEARWHDGKRVTAFDVAFTFEIYRDPVVNSFSRPRLNDIESVTVRDSSTAVFHFRRSYLEQFYDAVFHMHILPSHILADVPREELGTHPFTQNPVGNGPYRFVRWTPGQSIELAADSAFFLGRPGLPRVIWRFVSSPQVATAELLAGSAGFLHHISDPADVERIAASPQMQVIEYPSATYNFIGFNLHDPENRSQPHPLFGDRRLRRALTMGVDAQAIVQASLGSHGIVAVGPVPPAIWFWDESLEPALRYEPEQARALLREIGWNDSDNDGVLDRGGQRLSFSLLGRSDPIRSQVSLILQSQLQDIGIEMRIETPDQAAYADMVTNGRFDAQFASIGWDPSTASMLDWTAAGVGGMNYGGYVNPAFDRLVSEALNTSDPETARSRWLDALSILGGDAPAIWLYHPKKVAAVHERFANVSIFPYQPWSTLWKLTVNPSKLIERDRAGTN